MKKRRKKITTFKKKMKERKLRLEFPKKMNLLL